MTLPSVVRRTPGGLCVGVLALAMLAGCERRPTEVPTPMPGTPPISTPPITTPTTPSVGDTPSPPMMPPASAARQ